MLTPSSPPAKAFKSMASSSSKPKRKRAKTLYLKKSSTDYDILKLPANMFPGTTRSTTTLNKKKICTASINPTDTGCTLSSAYARRHYNEEKKLIEDKKSHRIQWDQPSIGKTQAEPGDLFGFVMTAGDFDKMEIFEVVEVDSHDKRREQWDKDIPEQKRKGVIYLSEYVGWVPTRRYVNAIGKGIPIVTQVNNKNFGKMSPQNGTQVFPWSSEIVVNVP